MPPRMPIVLDGVVMVIGLPLLILPPTRRSTPLPALIASSPVLVLGSNTNLSMVSWASGPTVSDEPSRKTRCARSLALVVISSLACTSMPMRSTRSASCRRLAERIAIGGRGDTDPCGGLADGEWRAEECERRRAKQRGARERSPHKHKFCHRSFSVTVPPANPDTSLHPGTNATTRKRHFGRQPRSRPRIGAPCAGQDSTIARTAARSGRTNQSRLFSTNWATFGGGPSPGGRSLIARRRTGRRRGQANRAACRPSLRQAAPQRKGGSCGA